MQSRDRLHPVAPGAHLCRSVGTGESRMDAPQITGIRIDILFLWMRNKGFTTLRDFGIAAGQSPGPEADPRSYPAPGSGDHPAHRRSAHAGDQPRRRVRVPAYPGLRKSRGMGAGIGRAENCPEPGMNVAGNNK
jgi:hypothetical protein